MPKRTGKTLADITARTDAGKPSGRPPLPERTEKITVGLYTRQITRLDRLTADFRDKTRGVVLKRAEIIRGLLDATSDDELKSLMNRIHAERAARTP